MNSRRFSWILMIVAGGMLAFTLLNPKKPQPAAQQPAPGPTTQATTGPAEIGPAATAPAISRPQWLVPTTPAEAIPTLGSTDPASGYDFEVTFDAAGAAVETIKLAEYFRTVDDKRLNQRLKNEQTYLETIAGDPKYRGHYALLEPVGAQGERYSSLQTNRLYVTDPSGQTLVYNLARQNWQLQPQTETTQPSDSVSFTWTLFRDANYAKPQADPDAQPVLRVTKTYTLGKGDYSLKMTLQVQNLSKDLPLQVGLDQAGPVGIEQEDPRTDDRRVALGVQKETRVDVSNKQTEQELSKATLGVRNYLKTDDTVWIGRTNKFFASLMYALPRSERFLIEPGYRSSYYWTAIADASPRGFEGRTYLTGITIGLKSSPTAAGEYFQTTLDLAPGATMEVPFSLYAGAKKRDLFQNNPLYSRLNYVGTIEIGGCLFCTFDWLALIVIRLLDMFSVITFGNYGLAIILLVILVRLALHPLTKKGQVSMMKMQKLGPKMAQLKEKYSDDKEALQRETMKLYKEQGATPILGCLPMLLQMPIWIALWGGLNADVELRHAAFLPIWITDLAAPDAVMRFKAVTVPLLSGLVGPISSLNILPLLLTVAMYFQTKLTPTTAGPVTPEQAAQQKMMKIMMPGMMLLFFYNAPSGLTLYIMTSTAAAVVEQFVIRKHIQEREAAQAAEGTIVEFGGKTPRSSRGKKPKGPFWHKQ